MTKQRGAESPFAKILSRLMEENGLGIREAARIACVPASTVMSWRSGALPQNYMAVKKLAEHLGTTLSFILTGQNDTKSSKVNLTELFEDGGVLFDGYAKISIQRLIPRKNNIKEK